MSRGNRLRPLIRDWQEPAIVLFGSPLNGKWVLDTVIVAAEEQRQSRPLSDQKRESKNAKDVPYRQLVLDCLAGVQQLRPIRGTAHGPSTPSMYSFVPATTTPETSFARPDVGCLFGDWLRKKSDDCPPSPRSAQQLSICSVERPEDFWKALIQQLTDARLVLAVELDAPAGWSTLT